MLDHYFKRSWQIRTFPPGRNESSLVGAPMSGMLLYHRGMCDAACRVDGYGR